jgi:hypothetical protein
MNIGHFMLRLGTVCSFALFGCGGSDDSAGGSGTEPSVEAGYDSTSQAVIATGPLGKTMVDAIVSVPIKAEPTAAGNRSGFQGCGQQNDGTCPTTTVQCQVQTVGTVTMEYKSSDSCKDGSGTPIQGTLVFSRNAARDWTVELKQLDRGGIVMNGTLRLQTSVGQPWSVTITDLKISGSATGSSEDPNCTKNCVRSQSYTANYTLTVSTAAPVSVQVDMTGSKMATVNGSVNVTGTVTGHVKVTAKGPLGGDQTVVDQDLNAQFSNRGVAFTNVTYPLPLSCTCPSSGSLSAASALNCGDLSVSFGASGSGQNCASATAAHTTSSALCTNTAKMLGMAVTAGCVPIQP